MQEQTLYGYFAFGFNYSIIKRTGLEAYERTVALELLDEFLTLLATLDLQVTAKIAEDIRNVMTKLAENKEERVDVENAAKVKEIVGKLDAALDAELQLKKAYILTKKRYPLESLLRNPDELLGKNVFQKLADNAKRDFELACLQIALSQPTAAAFHLMRALEQQVKVLYYAFKKTKRLDKPMWGPMTQQLRVKRAPKPSDKLLDHLDGMRIHFRNPTQHPESFYTLDEAQDLLNQTITAINMISAELP